ncbi:ANK-REP-REGION domain-containing protein [Mycena sanguinolenta]|uniref:ANK-REP-REGION domain-containing protein n=1 Tax=Mycena sanguinolenta TaxID=230812 RepID=A0A8H7CT74_9AGAR|nr:ANK-REP-REGION domain-containing protein [Mycena sanguinolenta]
MKDLNLVLDLADQARDITEAAPLIGSALTLLHKIIQWKFQVLRNAGKKYDLLLQHVTDLSCDICAVVLQMQEMDHLDEIGRLKRDFDKYVGLIQKAFQYISDFDLFSGVEHHMKLDELNQELELFRARLMTNRLVNLHLNQAGFGLVKPNEIIYNLNSVAQAPIMIYGGIGGPGGNGNIGGVGGTGGGPTVNFTNMMGIDVERLEKWLQYPPDMQQKQHDTEQLHSDGTGQWFLENDKFIEWEDNPGILWVEGPSGAGKTVLR